MGLAIRVGQSVGLHVKDSPDDSSNKDGKIIREIRRRTWYSMYVLDRLLALQLGRPVAINEADISRQLPSYTDDQGFEQANPATPQSLDKAPLRFEHYFLAVIEFSRIISHVLQDLYSPVRKVRSPNEILQSTAALDKRLLTWKSTLGRSLRFDIGHAFEGNRRLRKQVCFRFY